MIPIYNALGNNASPEGAEPSRFVPPPLRGLFRGKGRFRCPFA